MSTEGPRFGSDCICASLGCGQTVSTHFYYFIIIFHSIIIIIIIHYDYPYHHHYYSYLYYHHTNGVAAKVLNFDRLGKKVRTIDVC